MKVFKMCKAFQCKASVSFVLSLICLLWSVHIPYLYMASHREQLSCRVDAAGRCINGKMFQRSLDR